MTWKKEVFGPGEVEWRKYLAWVNCRDQQGSQCVSLGKNNPNSRLRLRVAIGRHLPVRVWENPSKTEDRMKSQLCAGLRGDIELEGDCWGRLIPLPQAGQECTAYRCP